MTARPRLLLLLLALAFAIPPASLAQAATSHVTLHISGIPADATADVIVLWSDAGSQHSLAADRVIGYAPTTATASFDVTTGDSIAIGAFVDTNADGAPSEGEPNGEVIVEACPIVAITGDATFDLPIGQMATDTSGCPTPSGGLTVTGRVVEYGAPAADVHVYLLDEHGFGYTGASGSDGTFTIDQVQPGSYTIGLYRADPYAYRVITAPVTIDADHLALGDLSLAELSGGTVRGALLLGDAPATGATISIWSDTASSVPPLASSGYARAAADGTYIVTGLVDGTYHAYVSGPDFAAVYQRDIIVIDSGHRTVTYSPVLAQAGSITGVISLADGTRVANVPVSAWSDAGGWAWNTTDDNGRYVLTGLSAGDYNVYADGASIGLLATGLWVPHGLHVASGETTTHDFTLSSGSTVHGRLLLEDGTPVPSTWVSAASTDWNTWSWGSNESASDGTFTIEGLSAGQHTLHVQPPTSAIRAYDATITVRDGANELSDITLEGGVTLRGRLVSNGAGVPNVNVYAYGDGSWADATTGADGAFTLIGLERADHTLVIEGASAGFARMTQAVSLAAGAVDLHDITLTPAGHIHGTVRTASAALENAWVSAYDATTGESGWTQTASDGTFDVAVPAGTYSLWISPAEAGLMRGSADGIVVTAGATTEQGAITLDTGRTVTVHVTDGASDVAGATVTLWGANGWGYGTTGADGKVAISGLGDGSYDAFASASSLADRTIQGAITLAGADAPLEIALSAPVTITGTLTNAAGPVQGANVYAWNDGASGEATTAADGTFTIPRLSAGTYNVEFVANGAVELASCDAGGAACDHTLAADTHAVAGRVLANAQPAEQATVTAVSTDGGAVRVASAITASDGTYRFPALAPGSYTITAVTGTGAGDSGSITVSVVDADVAASDINVGA